ncbi:hypothetical protein N7603_01190 [Acholeplasma vituli]|uniref:Uncharacterized protein n=1 Tax=Paracholeplasma vituli TaxID=69473 RepID=A0ABT2PTI7_9MOLU|nr:hypothetical protein [Paracholeplasma vituli]MCU0104265.1 hypothetical protein [Paracholeplasma vituli]
MDNIAVKPLEIKIALQKQACFGGAWYHKVMSIEYPFYGIEGTVTLPIPFIRRYDQNYKAKHVVDLNHKNLDVSSIYMGGHASDESDVGLALFRGYLDDQISTGAFVYRPFWRYITDEFEDIGTYDLEKGRNYAATLLSERNGIKNIYAQYHPSFTEYYYLPGDTLKLSLFSPKPNFMQLQITVIDVSRLPYSANLRRRYQMKVPQTFLSPMFSSKGHGTDMPKTYKRVNAIDQVRNEGKEAILTKTEILNAQWKNCFLYYKENNTLFKTL